MFFMVIDYFLLSMSFMTKSFECNQFTLIRGSKEGLNTRYHFTNHALFVVEIDADNSECTNKIHWYSLYFATETTVREQFAMSLKINVLTNFLRQGTDKVILKRLSSG